MQIIIGVIQLSQFVFGNKNRNLIEARQIQWHQPRHQLFSRRTISRFYPQSRLSRLTGLREISQKEDGIFSHVEFSFEVITSDMRARVRQIEVTGGGVGPQNGTTVRKKGQSQNRRSAVVCAATFQLQIDERGSLKKRSPSFSPT